MFRILSLAGGGLRGAFAIGLLAEIETRLERPLGEYFDLIAGTSTGSITAAALCNGMTAAQVEEFYETHAERIFSPREPFQPPAYFRALYALGRQFLSKRNRNLDHFFQSRYCPFSLNDALEEGFGNQSLGDLRKSRLLVPTVNLTDGVTRVFRTPHLPRISETRDWRIVDVIIASAAAPTYFPHKRMPDGKAYVDGGLWAIDPGVAALSEAVRITEQCCREEDTSFNLQEVWMLSIGTGQTRYSLSPPDEDAGMLYWSRHVAEVMGVSQVQGTQLPLKFVLEERYRQINFEMTDPTWTLDNTRITGQLFELGHERGRDEFAELKPLFFATPTTPYQPFQVDENAFELQ
jgi:patatin-like phospholipase/acyl hydrolase